MAHRLILQILLEASGYLPMGHSVADLTNTAPDSKESQKYSYRLEVNLLRVTLITIPELRTVSDV